MKEGVWRPRVLKESDNVYKLQCSVCGETAAVFRVRTFHGGDGLIYSGITHETVLPLRYVDKVFDLLEKDRISEVHSYVKTFVTMEEGIDAYCPTCDEIYCRKHWTIKEYWDQGFYDYTEGTCPKGHTRIIHD